MDCFATLAMTEERKKAEIAPGLLRFFTPSCPGLSRASTSYFVKNKVVDGRVKPGHDDVGNLFRFRPLGRRGRPRLYQRVVVDGFALRLLVGQLALGRDVAVLFR